MNIFILDDNIEKSAQYHVDKHVVKMILESAQLLCTSHHVRYNFVGNIGHKLSSDELKKVKANKNPNVPYAVTHPNHPCAIWTRASSSNYNYLWTLAFELNNEYQYRYGKTHKSWDQVIINLPDFYTDDIELTPFALAMPDEYKTNSAVESYRNYYKKAKSHIASWKNRPIPEWWNDY